MLISFHLCEVISFFVTGKYQKSKKFIKIKSIDEENNHIFWKSWGISMKFSGKIWITIILKVIKNQGFPLFLEDTFSGKPQRCGQIDPILPRRLKVKKVFGCQELRRCRSSLSQVFCKPAVLKNYPKSQVRHATLLKRCYNKICILQMFHRTPPDDFCSGCQMTWFVNK